MRNEWGGQGFSMVELLVTMVIGALAIAFMSSAYIAQKRVAEGESSLREVNVRAQLVMNRIKQYIRNAGLGAESNLTKGASVLEGANRSYGDVFTAEARSDGPRRPDRCHRFSGSCPRGLSWGNLHKHTVHGRGPPRKL